MTTFEQDERSAVIPAVIGFFLGVGLALVWTPKSGRQLRGNLSKDLNRRVRKAKDTLEETFGLVKEQGKEVIEVAEEVIQEAKRAFEAERNQVQQAIMDTKSKPE